MRECVATVGTFDGVHLGHRAILRRVTDLARERGLESRVVTFLNHPLTVVAPERAPLWIESRDDVEVGLAYRGIERVSWLRFTPELAALTAAGFFELLRERYNVRVLVMGHDNSFGSDRLPSHEAYIEAGREAGIEVQFVDPVLTDGDHRPVSSSRLRHAIADGDMAEARRLLGMPYSITGTVVRGKRNGHRLGFPTMNIDVDAEGLVPLRTGVYMAVMRMPDTHRDYRPGSENLMTGVLNVGTNPTIAEGNPVTYELHIPGVKLGDMYGEYIIVPLLDRLRDEQRFDSLDDLRRQIARDIEGAMERLDEILTNEPESRGNFCRAQVKLLAKSCKLT